MSTLRYVDYTSGVTAGTIDLTNMYYTVKLVAETYEPDEIHTPADIAPFIIAALGVLQQDDILHDSMSVIIDKAKEALKEGMELFPDLVIAQAEQVILDTEKLEKFKELISMPSGDEHQQYQFWEKIKECGVKWFVFEESPSGILCFCEEIQM